MPSEPCPEKSTMKAMMTRFQTIDTTAGMVKRS
jgi:hypothetical protein